MHNLIRMLIPGKKEIFYETSNHCAIQGVLFISLGCNPAGTHSTEDYIQHTNEKVFEIEIISSQCVKEEINHERRF